MFLLLLHWLLSSILFNQTPALSDPLATTDTASFAPLSSQPAIIPFSVTIEHGNGSHPDLNHSPLSVVVDDVPPTAVPLHVVPPAIPSPPLSVSTNFTVPSPAASASTSLSHQLLPWSLVMTLLLPPLLLQTPKSPLCQDSTIQELKVMTLTTEAALAADKV